MKRTEEKDNNSQIHLSHGSISKIIVNILILHLVGTFLLSCRTTDSKDHVIVNAAQSDGLFYSTIDERTSFIHQERIEDLKSLRDRLSEHVKENKSDLEAMVALSQVHVALGDLISAENFCRLILRKDLKNAGARKVLGQIALKRGHGDLALIYFSSLGGVNSKDSSVINMIAQVELQKGNYSAAMALFKKAIRLDPNDHAARLNLGVLYIKHRQMLLASVELERILKSEPNNLEAKIHLAIVMLSRQETSQAKEMLESVLDVDSENPLALYNLAVAYKMEKDFDSALDTLKKYVSSKRVKPIDNNQAFTLMNKIQKAQTADGVDVSDDEIQDMAADLKKNGKQRQAKAAKAPKGKMASKTSNSKDSGASKGSFYGSEGEDIESLEKTLK